MDQNDRKQERIEHLRHKNEEVGNVYDFSEGGMALFLDRTVAMGQVSRIKILVGDLSLTTKVTAAHCAASGNLYRAGFQFTDLAGESRSILREMAARHSRGVPVTISFC